MVRQRGDRTRIRFRANTKCRARAGNASLDYILVLGVVLPLIGFVFVVGPRLMNLFYEMTSVLVSWPFL